MSAAPIRPQNFYETAHEIISMVILPMLLIKEKQLSVIGKSMCTSIGILLEDSAWPGKSVKYVQFVLI